MWMSRVCRRIDRVGRINVFSPPRGKGMVPVGVCDGAPLTTDRVWKACRRCARLVCCVIVIMQAGLTLAEDIVIVTPRLDADAQLRRKGTILDYTGTALTLQLPGGREEQIPTARVVGYETQRVPDQQNADQLFAEGRYADAVVSYRRAVEAEPRKWLRREILAQLVRCYKNLQQYVRAGDTFLLIMQSDPTTQLLDAIPLVWKPEQPSPEMAQRAGGWMQDPDLPVARLIGASWLLFTTSREEAVETLSALGTNADPRIALLAETQRWRAEMVTATLEQAQRWQQQLPRLDDSLQAGPCFVLGQTLARHNLHEEAALAFLRTAILHSVEVDLATESLFAAGEQLEKMGNGVGAGTIYRELLQKHPTHALAPLAEQRLARIVPQAARPPTK